MNRRLWLSLVMLAAGASLVVAASLANAASTTPQKVQSGVAKRGGTLHLSKSVEVDYVDPALAYFAEEWSLENNTCARLLQYPDSGGPRGLKLVPEVAAGFPKVSPNGRIFTFTVRSNFKYNTGKTVTADDFRWAMDRMASAKQQSATYSYHRDIVGYSDNFNGDQGNLRGVKVSGNKLIVTLTGAAPDFPARTTMPFFCPLPRSVKIDPNGTTSPPGSGPYYFSKADVNRQIVLKRNPHYGGKRPANPNQIVFDLNGGSLASCKLKVDKGQEDFCTDGIPPAEYAGLAKQYGINKKRLFVEKGVFVLYMAMNTQHGLMKNVKVRKGIAEAINRPALVAQSGSLAGVAYDHILPTSIPGAKNTHVYPVKLNSAAIAKAKKLIGSGGDVVMYQGNRSPRPERAAVMQASLKQVGINVDVKLMSRPTQKERTGRKGEPFDITDEGWAADFLDPKSYFDPLLNGHTISETENVNISYFNVERYNKKIEAAGRLAGAKRFKTYGALDIDIEKNQAPWAVYQNSNDRYYVSSHVGCVTIHPVFEILYGAVCLS
jgi:peptide/nickel transport system substrate-binding protein